MDRLRYLLGVMTLAVMVVASWFVYGLLEQDDLADLYRIEVVFKDARGLKPGADAKYLGIQVGSVRRIHAGKEGRNAVVVITIDDDNSRFVRDNTSFWIVTPRFHGLSRGVSGLDTLVRDAYVSFLTPEPFGEPTPSGNRVLGSEAPVVAKTDVILPPIRRGDLIMRVLLPENHGVSVGARVMFRGMATGEVRDIALAPSGTHVEVKVRISSHYRSTVTDKSVFWVAQPRVNLQFSFSNPVAVNELGALISPYIAYYTEPKTGVPVYDNYPVAASMKRPSIQITDVPAAALERPADVGTEVITGPIALVRIVYEAVDVDWLSMNDKLHREGTGLLYVDESGRALVVTARSVCDASYYYRETFGEKASIKDENIGVLLADGTSLAATRAWTQPQGIDLAVLWVVALDRKYPTTRPEVVSYIASKELPESGLNLRVAGERGVPMKPAPFKLSDVQLNESRGGLLMHGETVVGFVGQVSDSDGNAAAITLKTLPKTLRPAR